MNKSGGETETREGRKEKRRPRREKDCSWCMGAESKSRIFLIKARRTQHTAKIGVEPCAFSHPKTNSHLRQKLLKGSQHFCCIPESSSALAWTGHLEGPLALACSKPRPKLCAPNLHPAQFASRSPFLF